MATRTITTAIKLDGEAEFKKQMSSVNSELKTLSSELKLSESEFKGQANTVEALTAKDKLLKDQIEQQKVKVDALTQAVKDSAEAYGDTDKRTDSYRQQLNNAKIALNNLNGDLKSNAKYMDEAKSSTSGCASSIDEYGKEVKEAGEKTLSFGDVLKANVIGDAIVSGVRALADAARDVSGALKDAVVDGAAYADNIMTMSTVTGLSTDALQEYQYMAELTDTSVDTITGSLTKLTKNMETAKGGTGSASEAFKALGISITNSDGSLRSNQDVFAETIEALGGMTNETQRNAYSMEIFGKSAQDLNPLIAQGKDGIAKFAQEAHDMGYVLDGDTLSSLGAVDDAFQRFNNMQTVVKNQLAEQLAPVVTDVANKLQAWSESVDWDAVGGDIRGVIENAQEIFTVVQDNWESIVTAVATITAAVVSFKTAMAISGLIQGATEAMAAYRAANESATVAQALLNGVMNANPFVLVATLIAAVGTALVTLYMTNDDFREKVQGAWNTLKTSAETVFGTIKNVIGAVGDKFNEVKETIEKKVDEFKSIGENIVHGIWNGISGSYDWIKDKITGWVGNVVDFFKSVFGIHSPSAVMRDQVGQYLAKGVVDGFVDNIDADAMAAAIPSNFEIAAQLNANIKKPQISPVSSEQYQAGLAPAVNALMTGGQTGQPVTVRHDHTGTIRVEGVNSEGQLIAIKEFLMEDLRNEVRMQS